MCRARTGDRASFVELINRYERPLYGYLYRILRDPEAARDAFQETWFKLQAALDRFDPNLRFAPWLYRIAANHARDMLRRKRHRNHASLDQPLTADGDRTLGDRMAGSDETPEEAVISRDVGHQIRLAVDELPRRQREAFILRHYQGLSYEEIATSLRCSLSSVKSNIHHAVVRLREVLTRVGLGPEEPSPSGVTVSGPPMSMTPVPSPRKSASTG